MPDLVRELVGLGVEVLVIVGLPAARAALSAAPAMPVVVIDPGTDPVKAGFLGKAQTQLGGIVSRKDKPH